MPNVHNFALIYTKLDYKKENPHILDVSVLAIGSFLDSGVATSLSCRILFMEYEACGSYLRQGFRLALTGAVDD